MAGSQSLKNLYLSRLREFYRQPARIFWVYGFPTVLAICLGLAFKSQPAETIQIDLVSNSASGPFEKAFADYNAKAAGAGKLRVVVKVGAQEIAIKRLMTGKTPLVIEPQVGKPLLYRFDPTRPEATTARVAAKLMAGALTLRLIMPHSVADAAHMMDVTMPARPPSQGVMSPVIQQPCSVPLSRRWIEEEPPTL